MAFRPLLFVGITLSLFVVAGMCPRQDAPGGLSSQPPAAKPESPAAAKPATFDSARAFADLEKQVKFGPRVTGTTGHKECREWLVAEFKKICGNAERQDFKVILKNARGRTPEEINLSNIYARINPEAKKQILLCAHWDTRPSADMEEDEARQDKPIPGANDGASGVAVLLELARIFAAKKPDVGVQFVLFDGEDYGPNSERMFLGAKYYARKPALPRPDYAILIDMIGDKDLAIPREKRSELLNKEINDKVWNAAKELGSKAFISQVGHYVNGELDEIWDDHLPLLEAGWKAIDLIDFEYPAWHTLSDTPDKCSPASLKTIGDVLAKVVYEEK